MKLYSSGRGEELAITKLFVAEEGKTQVLERQSFDNDKLLQDILEIFPEFIALDD